MSMMCVQLLLYVVFSCCFCFFKNSNNSNVFDSKGVRTSLFTLNQLTHQGSQNLKSLQNVATRNMCLRGLQ